MNTFITIVRAEPLAVRSIIVAAVTAITGVIASQVGIDIDIDPEAIAGLVVAAVTGTVWARSKVSPVR